MIRNFLISVTLVTVLLSISACGTGQGNPSESAWIQVSTQASRVLVSHNSQSAFPESLTAIVLRVEDGAGRVYLNTDLLDGLNDITAEVPAHTLLLVSGVAYAGDTRIYESAAEIQPLAPGTRNSLTLVFSPVGTLMADMVRSPVQVDLSASAQTADNRSDQAVFSGDNRQVLFSSLAANLIAADNNNTDDIFIKNLVTGAVANVHTSSTGEQADGPLLEADLSADGSVVVFSSDAGNLVPGDTNTVTDVFLKNLGTGSTERVSLFDNGLQTTRASRSPTLSADGKKVAFYSDNDLTQIGGAGIFLLLRGDSGNVLQHVGMGDHPKLSGDGNWLLYSQAAAGSESMARLMLYNITQNQNRGILNYLPSDPPAHSINFDGNYTAFATTTSFDANDTDSGSDVYLYHLQSDTLSLLSTDRNGQALDGDARFPDISDDGRYVVFSLGETVYVKDAHTGETANLTVPGFGAVLSPNGQLIAYTRTDDSHLYVVANPLFVQPTPDASPVPPVAQPIPQSSYRLTVGKAGTGQGTVTSNDGLIDCGVTCTQTYENSVSVTLTAQAQPGSVFVRWGGLCVGTGNTVSVTVDGVRNCQAVFNLDLPPVQSYSIGGSISNLTGTGLRLQNNGGDTLDVSAGSSSFTFATPVTDGGNYAVAVQIQPSSPNQVCEVINGAGTVAGANISNVGITCTTRSYTVGGAVSGLSGTGLQLRNNNGDTLDVPAGSGSFVFPVPLADGSDYAVTILNQPSSPVQTCNVSNSTGKVAGSDVTGINITCASNTYTLGGSITGLTGSGLQLSNSVETLNVAAGSTGFTFTSALADGTDYAVTVVASPISPSQTCEVTNGSGTLSGADINSVSIVCTTNTFTIGGSITGLSGSGLQVQNNAGDTLDIAAGSAGFTFATALADGSAYGVTVLSQPSAPNQICEVTSGSGTLAGTNIVNVSISCTTNTHTVGGSITGLTGSGLQIQNNGGDTLTITSGSTSFTFPTALADGSAYNVTVLASPTGPNQSCNVVNGTGALAGTAITTVSITCTDATYTIGGSITGLTGTGLQLQNNGGDVLNVAPGSTGFTFATALSDGSNYAVTVLTPPATPSQTCNVTNGTGTLAGANVNTISVNCVNAPGDYTIGGFYTADLPGSLVLLNNGTDELTVSNNGSFSFALPVKTGDSYDITIKTPANYMKCSVQDGQGVVGTVNVTSVAVLCVGRYRVDHIPLSKEVKLKWQNATNPSSSLYATSFDLYTSSAPGCDVFNIGACPNGQMFANVTSPYLLGGLTNGQPLFIQLVRNYSAGHQIISNEIGTTPNSLAFPKNPNSSTRASIDDIQVDSNGNTYLFGDFGSVAADTGGGIPFSTTQAFPANFDYDKVAGEVTAVVSDGAGGYFIAGNFTHVGSALRQGLAHILANGKVDLQWNAGFTGLGVEVLELNPAANTLYIGGEFTHINDQPRANLGAVSTIDGSLMNWNSGGANSGVYALMYAPAAVIAGTPATDTPNSLFVGGNFTTIGGVARERLAALTTDNDIASVLPWNPGADSIVRQFGLANDIVYAGGNFSVIGGTGPAYLAAVQRGTGSIISWQPLPNGYITDFAIDGGLMYVVGSYSSMNGISTGSVAAINLSDGTVAPWDVRASGYFSSIVVSADTVYVVGQGNFIWISNYGQAKMAAIDKATGLIRDWLVTPIGYNNPDLITKLALSGSTIYVGGNFHSIGANFGSGSRLVSLRPDGRLRPISLGDFYIRTMAVAGTTLYIGGDFRTIYGATRNFLAAADVSGDIPVLTDWNPDPDGGVYGIAIAGGKAYVSGRFSNIGGQVRAGFAELDLAVNTNNATAFNPERSGGIAAKFSVINDEINQKLYIGGVNMLVPGTTDRRWLSAFDTSVQPYALTAFDPIAEPAGQVLDMILDGTTLYVAGNFTAAGGAANVGLAALDTQLDTTNAIAWSTGITSGTVSSIDLYNGVLYAAGEFTLPLPGAQIQPNLAAFDMRATLYGSLLPWNPEPDSWLTTILATPEGIHAGGKTRFMNGVSAYGFGLIPHAVR